jgi:hypothetical protein
MAISGLMPDFPWMTLRQNSPWKTKGGVRISGRKKFSRAGSRRSQIGDGGDSELTLPEGIPDGFHRTQTDFLTSIRF